MTTILILLGAWVLLSAPLGILIAAMLRKSAALEAARLPKAQPAERRPLPVR